MKESAKVLSRFLRVRRFCVAFGLLLSCYRGYGQQAESLLERGIGAIPPAADTESGIVVEYAYRFFEMRNGLPGVEWHFRWCPGKLDGDRADAVFTENTAFTKVLRSPPVLTWDVHVREATGRIRFVGTFTERFHGLAPVFPGEWGVGMAHGWPGGWSTLFMPGTEGAVPLHPSQRFLGFLVFTSPSGGSAVSRIGEFTDWERGAMAEHISEAGAEALKKEWQERGGSADLRITSAEIKFHTYGTRAEAEGARQKLLRTPRSVSWEYIPADPVVPLIRQFVKQGIELRNPRFASVDFVPPVIGKDGGMVRPAQKAPPSDRQGKVLQQTIFLEMDRLWDEKESK